MNHDIKEYEFKIGDLGLAKPLSSKDELSETIAGTLLMMAPEMINNKEYDNSVDVWSLGALLYQILVGRTPFDANN